MTKIFWRGASRKQRLLYMGLVICIGFGLLFAFRYWSTHKASADKAGGRLATTVDVGTVTHRDLVKRISLTGQTVPEAQVDIAAKYQGRVTAVNVSLGQAIQPGQVLIVQDTGDADISISQNRAAYSQAAADAVTTEATFNANYDRARADYEKNLASYQRNKALYAAGAISKEALDTSLQQVADAKASVDTLENQMNQGMAAAIQSSQSAALKAQHSISAAEKQRNDLVLTAPRGGVIGYRQIEAGDIAQAGQKLLSIFDNSHIYVDCQVSEQDLPALSLGMPVSVGVESLGKTYPGKITYISPASDATTLTFMLRIALDNPDSSVRSGMFTRTIINSVLRPQAVTVPKDAIVEKNGSAYVFVVGANNTLEQRTVQLGARGDDAIEILTGLNEGEKIALTNLARLRAGLVINPQLVDTTKSGDQP